jgi:TRAP-type C4-dicarboxylate transport system permease small subunit
MMAIVIPFGIVYCAHEKGHVSVDVLFDLLPKRIQGVFSCITSLIVIVLFILIAWQNVLFVHETYESGLTSAVLYIPSYPFVGTIALGFVALCLVLLADFLNILLETVSK